MVSINSVVSVVNPAPESPTTLVTLPSTNVFKSGTLKSGTPECTPKIESGAGAALILEIGSGEGAALNIFGSMVMSSTLTFSVH